MTNLTTEEWCAKLGESIRALRIEAELEMATLASRAQISVRTLRGIEHGVPGTSIGALVAIVRALNREDWLSAIAPALSVSPYDLLRTGGKRRMRVRKSNPGS